MHGHDRHNNYIVNYTCQLHVSANTIFGHHLAAIPAGFPLKPTTPH